MSHSLLYIGGVLKKSFFQKWRGFVGFCLSVFVNDYRATVYVKKKCAAVVPRSVNQKGKWHSEDSQTHRRGGDWEDYGPRASVKETC